MNDVGEFHTVRFLQQAAARDPERFIDLFFARMDRKVAADADYRPVPFREVNFTQPLLALTARRRLPSVPTVSSRPRQTRIAHLLLAVGTQNC